jgi:hypothetical protein
MCITKLLVNIQSSSSVILYFLLNSAIF